MLASPPFDTCTLTPQTAYVSTDRPDKPYTLWAFCMEIPHPDHEAGGLTVNSVTGAPSEFSQVSQWTFVATWFPAIEKSGVSAFDFRRARKVQTRALSQTYWSPSKVRGR